MRPAPGKQRGRAVRSRERLHLDSLPKLVFNVGHVMGPTQTGPWRLLLLAAADFCGMAALNAIQRCREAPDRIHLRA